MPANYVLLEKITVGAAGASSVTFSGIPQTGYTDLLLKASCRSNQSNVARSWKVQPNGVDITARNLDAEGNPFVAFSSTIANMNANGTGSTSNTFNNYDVYIPNYASTTTYKSLSVDGAVENNGTDANLKLVAGLYSSNTAISSITCIINAGLFVQYSTFYLYGVAALGTTPVIVPYATGGDTIMTDGTYWYHAFKASGTFTPLKGLSCDVVVVAGGGAGGSGGGGAGGYRKGTALSVSSAITVTVGAGGTAMTSGNNGTSGNDSTFSSITSTGGGKGNLTIVAASGGSGGGGSGNNGSSDITGGAGNTPSTSPSQGNSGGSGASGGVTGRGGGGGGGAGAVGSAGSVNAGGNGGAGSNTDSSWLSVVGMGVSGYLAGGGGGGSNGLPYGTGGAGGGGSGGDSGNAVAGTANTGGGGGGVYGAYPSGAGGSGIVIVRYAV